MPDLIAGRILMLRNAALLVCALFAAALIAVTVDPRIDLTVSGWFYANGHFTMENNAVFGFLHETAVRGAWALGFIFITMLVVSLIPPCRRMAGLKPKAWLFLLLALVVGPVLITNGILKDHWGRARPHEVTEFGGTAPFTPALIPQEHATRNESFIAGDGAFGFYLPCFAYLLPLASRRKESLAVFWGAMASGCVFAFSRIAMGSHFFSDNLFAALFMSLSNAGIHAAIFGRKVTRAYWRLWLGLDKA